MEVGVTFTNYNSVGSVVDKVDVSFIGELVNYFEGFTLIDQIIPSIFLCITTAILGIQVVPSRLSIIKYYFSLFMTLTIYGLSLLLWVFFDASHSGFQFITEVRCVEVLSSNLLFGVDGVALFFVLLTTFTFPFCILFSEKEINKSILQINLLAIELCFVFSFLVLDLLFFCVSFEAIVLPMVLIMVSQGQRDRRIKAVTYLVMYTLFGSIFLLWAMFLLYFDIQNFSYIYLMSPAHRMSMDSSTQHWVWGLLMVGFALKIPVFPFHIWLPEAHVEAPTTASVLLAALLLKLGSYGIIRFLFLFDDAKYYFQEIITVFCLAGIFVASVLALNQQDMKRIIAYSSVAHMNFALLGYFTNNIYGLVGGSALMLSHGIVSAALFFLVGVLYVRYSERDIKKYGGLVLIMPLYITGLGVFIFSNAAVPATSNFVGEFLVLISLAQAPLCDVTFLLALLSTLLGLVYSVKFFNQIAFGTLKLPNLSQIKIDLMRAEAYILIPLFCINLIFGVVPAAAFAVFYYSMLHLLVCWEKVLWLEDEHELSNLPLPSTEDIWEATQKTLVVMNDGSKGVLVPENYFQRLWINKAFIDRADTFEKFEKTLETFKIGIPKPPLNISDYEMARFWEAYDPEKHQFMEEIFLLHPITRELVQALRANSVTQEDVAFLKKKLAEGPDTEEWYNKVMRDWTISTTKPPAYGYLTDAELGDLITADVGEQDEVVNMLISLSPTMRAWRPNPVTPEDVAFLKQQLAEGPDTEEWYNEVMQTWTISTTRSPQYMDDYELYIILDKGYEIWGPDYDDFHWAFLAATYPFPY